MAINVITVSGHVGKDCECRYTQNGKAIGSFSIPAVTGWGDNKKTAWLTCKLFGERAEKLSPYLTKGTPVTVTGAFALDEWQDQQGNQKSRPVILVNDVAMHGGSKQPGEQNNRQQQQNNRPQRPQRPKPQQQSGAFDDFDDDIPF